MKTNIIIIALFSVLLSSGCSTYIATYEETPLNIDGSSSDWKTTLDSKDKNSYSYGVSNDQENVYIRININDQSIQKKIMLAGLTVWIDTTGKKKENLGITCPIRKPLAKLDRKINTRIQKDPVWNQNQLLEVEFLGFKEHIENHFISQNPYGVEVSIDQDDFKSLYYEMKIPFKAIYSDYADISQKRLSIGLDTGVLRSPSSGGSKSVGMRKGSGGGSMGSGGRGGRGMGSKNPLGTQNSPITNLSSPTKTWIKNIRLAKY